MSAFHWNPLEYEKHSSQQQLWAQELIAKLGLLGAERVLDVGCGDGKITVQIAGQVPNGFVLGIDNSAGMVALAEQRFPPHAFPNLRFQLEDASRLPFQAEFNLVFSNAVLHWISDHRPVLHGIAASLKPGGRALLQMGGKGNAADIVAGWDRLAQSPRWSAYFSDFSLPYGFYGPQEYRAWLVEAGLKPLRVELFPRDMVHPNPEGLAGWLRTTWMPYTGRIPEAQREAFLAEMVASYLAKFPPDGEGKTHVRMVRLEVEAIKK